MGTRQTTITEFRDGVMVRTVPVTYETTPEQDNDEAIRGQAAQALATNRTFIGLASPTNAQVVAQVKALSRQNNALIRLALGLLDGTD
jgi:hypothetical protein